MQSTGTKVVAPSAIPATGWKYHHIPGNPGHTTNIHAVSDPSALIETYRRAALLANKAGFDGVELLCQGGFLPHQFLSSRSNIRTDAYGGSVENRCRFVLELVCMLGETTPGGLNRVIVKMAPCDVLNDSVVGYDEMIETYTYLIGKLVEMGLGAICISRRGGRHESRDGMFERPPEGEFALPEGFDAVLEFGPLVKRKGSRTLLIAAQDYSAEEAERTVAEGKADMVQLGRAFVWNADLVGRIGKGLPLAENGRGGWVLYGPGPGGCVDEGIDDSSPPPTPRPIENPRLDVGHERLRVPHTEHPVAESGQPSRRASVEAEAAFDNGLHVGPTSGVAFLYRWAEEGFNEAAPTADATPLTSYGDTSIPQVAKAPLPDLAEGKALIEHYFRFSMPTFRFFHQQTLERCMQDLVLRKPLPSIQAASVLVVLSHALMYSEDAPTAPYRISERSLSYLQQARTLFNNEVGPASVASVEARVAACLVLLSISHFNECRYLFAMVHALVISLGIHRRTPKQYKMSPLESQRRKRVFWSFYGIDGYVSVLLGQPRLLRDEDVDQEYPDNVEDVLLDTATDLSQCPHHGTLEAALYHARLARLFAKANDMLYPIQSLSTVEILRRSEVMIDALDDLQRELPAYLQPRLAASIGVLPHERQNTVLSLAFSHAYILATRRTILLKTTGESYQAEDRERHQRSIRTCVSAICSMVDRVHHMIEHKRLLWGFWLTQYVMTAAISTFLVFKLEHARQNVSYEASSVDLREYYAKADEIQKYLSLIAPEGSQARRHHQLLERLKQRANRAHLKARTSRHGEETTKGAIRATSLNADTTLSPRLDIYDEYAPASNANADQLTPNMFDYAFLDASSWQFLDQLGSADFDYTPDLWSIP
ncbi:putative 12-oxophytodienoate 4 [Cyphellophora attinorum]|uniref:Putative 12-oxophytodienoate 4 n=1 Tax=Cyphellophora attinorum TaxID=1664694 RepID=A0A0N0NHH3_9EURO|nr:putative 12-oxophytodienoate 4 [Phialophora attinorum]KPI34691.1 putative 12-oxophytodienoate 4 [Phialophora attinorum]